MLLGILAKTLPRGSFIAQIMIVQLRNQCLSITALLPYSVAAISPAVLHVISIARF